VQKAGIRVPVTARWCISARNRLLSRLQRLVVLRDRNFGYRFFHYRGPLVGLKAVIEVICIAIPVVLVLVLIASVWIKRSLAIIDRLNED
jgi:hypothetical protein